MSARGATLIAFELGRCGLVLEVLAMIVVTQLVIWQEDLRSLLARLGDEKRHAIFHGNALRCCAPWIEVCSPESALTVT